MKALVLHGPNDFRVEEVPMPEIGKGDLLVKVKACAICGTDIRILEGKKTKDVRYPSTIGHEISGTIVEVGEDVTGFEVSDNVAIANVIPCGHCHSCLTGRENACMQRKAIGYQYDGGFAEYVKIPSIAIKTGNVIKFNEEVSFNEAALTEPMACCVNGSRKTGVQLGETVLIVGAGPIGLMHLQLAIADGAGCVIVNEPIEHRRKMAADLGATYAVGLDSAGLAEFVKEITHGLGVDRIVMAIGVTSIINDTIKLLCKGGTINLFAGFGGKGEAMVEANLIHYNEITVNGTSAYTRYDYLTSFDLIKNKRVNVNGLVSHEFSLEDFNKAYEVCKSGEGVKVVIHP
jgi:L-iditol 2-dehydrogenase